MQMQTQKYDIMQPVQHLDLWEVYLKTKSVDIRNKIVVEYSPIVKKIASKVIGNYQYFSYLDDLVNEGIIALMDAVEKFDLDKNVKFETFASIKIKGAMIDFIRKQDCFPRRIKKMSRDISVAETELSNQLGRTPTQQELADKLCVTVKQLEKMQLEVYSLNVYSFEQVLFESNAESTLLDLLATTADSPEQRLANQEVCSMISAAIADLKDNEKMVIALHYKEQLKIKDIANILKISDSRVSQIHSNALKKLKKVLVSYTHM